MADITVLARRYRLQLNMGSEAVPDWQTVFGIVEFKPNPSEATRQDDADYETEGWGDQTTTMLKWSVEVKISHKADPDTGVFHPTHVKLRSAARSFGGASQVHLRYFDREGRDEAYEGYALVDWKPEGGDQEQLDRVTVTFVGKGKLNEIANPLNATPVPIVSSVSPSSGPAAGGTLVVIRGANFAGATDVEFDDVNAASFLVISDTEVAAVTPAGSAGPANVDVTTPNGTGTGTGVFTYS